jgi:hypothetical protein
MNGFYAPMSLAGTSMGASTRTTRPYRSYNATMKPEMVPEFLDEDLLALFTFCL